MPVLDAEELTILTAWAEGASEIDNGWREVADTALKFVQRFVTP